MGFVTKPFQCFLSKNLTASDVYLPIAQSPYADLLALLKDKCDYTLLALKDEVGYEVVKAYADGGVIILERGQGGTEATKFSYGACVSAASPLTVAIIQSYIHELLNCSCTTAGTTAEVLEIASISLPTGSVSVPYSGYLQFSGVLPIDVTVSGAPSWACVVQMANVVSITGTPTQTGTYTLHVKATNCGTTNTVERNIQFAIA